MPTYILQKDLPNLKAGTQFILDDHNHKYYVAKQDDIYNERTYYKRELVENNPEWFLPKEEDKYIVLSIHPFTGTGNIGGLSITTNKDIKNYSYDKIKEAIERVLNEESENINVDLKPEGLGVHVHVWVPIDENDIITKKDIIDSIKDSVYRKKSYKI